MSTAATDLAVPSLDGPFVRWADVRAAQVWRYRNRPADPLARDLAAQLGADANVLDYGCGTGRHLRFLASRGHHVTGLDPGLGQLEVAEQIASADLRLLTFGTPVPLPDGTVDAALSTWAIYHGRKATLDWSISEVLRVLKPGAPFFFHLISTADFKHGHGRRLETGTYTEARAGSVGELHHFSSPAEAQAIARRFSRAEIRHVRHPLVLEPNEFDVGLPPGAPTCAHWIIKAWK